MKLETLISNVKKEKPNSFSNDHLTKFVNELEAIVLTWLEEDVIEYTWEKHKGRRLVVEPPYDCIYESWLKAKIDYAHEEYQSYENNSVQFNEDFQTWKNYMESHGKVEPIQPHAIKNWW